jgi:hypothetical protein
MSNEKALDERTSERQSEVEEVVSDFGDVHVRSSFEMIEEAPGQLYFSIEGPG